MPNSPSVQLPDLLSVARTLELRTNPHCFTVSAASQAWFTAHPALTEAERTSLASVKPGLWAAVCFPTCDPPQLRLVTDFLTALLISNTRLVHGQPCPSGDLAQDPLFQDVLKRILACPASETWRVRFTQSCAAYRNAAHRFQNESCPNLYAYIPLRRALSGLPLLFDLVELAEGLKMPPPDDRWQEAQKASADVIALSLDVMAYNNDQYLGNDFNLVSIIRTEQDLSHQAAMNAAFVRVQAASARFVSASESLRGVPQAVATSPQPSWIQSLSLWGAPKQSSESPTEPPLLERDERLYLRGLEDCIAGTFYWAYESETYFGKKGDEVSKFGWVFLRRREVEVEAGGAQQ
ncbi:isoprenoid synthase domain-containing protein [Roridomyces roridus]|uniref:Isoprenoid synthase domain-containing protein n=1 Tax=Roridomyces roridus TaxID=1738132 RepID=A0AAD7FWT9_9AGAR|nr:isoprenoid synthase domain-containing protein [Roridomyces roridus]